MTLTLTLTLNLLNRLAAIGAECMNTVNRRKQTNNTWSAIDKNNKPVGDMVRSLV